MCGKLLHRFPTSKTTGNNGRDYIPCLCALAVERPCARSPIRDIASDPAKAKIEIVFSQKEIKRLRKEVAKVLLDNEMTDKRVLASSDKGAKVNKALNIMVPIIELSHIAAIHIYCIKKNEKVNARSFYNTVVECFI